MQTLDLDKWPGTAPNPPPWEVIYKSDSQAKNGRDVLPIAYTIGLTRLGLELKRNLPELCVCKASPQIASALLDRLGVWLVFEGGTIEIGQQFLIGGVEYTIALESPESERGLYGSPTFRLAWYKDPIKQQDYSSAQMQRP